MVEEDRSEEVADLVRRGVVAAKAQKWTEAAALLLAAVDDPALVSSVDLQDVRARVLAVYARALLESGQPAEALVRAEQALLLAGIVGDSEEVPDLKALVETARVALASSRRAANKPPGAALDEDPNDAPSDAARALAWCRKAEALLASGRAAEALVAAEQAISLAPHEAIRTRMLARLVGARAAPEQAQVLLNAAWIEADAQSESTWLTAVAKAAVLAGLSVGAVESSGPSKNP